MSCTIMEKKLFNINELTTPSRKRKRETENYLKESNGNKCFSNAGFSSTPKKLIGKRRKATDITTNTYVDHSCLEIKSIADIVQENATPIVEETTTNPFEVVRKPPKKRKKSEAEIAGACFENAALNLEIPDKQFNPYEVVRPKSIKSPVKEIGFVNEALNIRGQDISAAQNPFEIQRCKVTIPTDGGVENLALDEATTGTIQPCGLQIALPFTPTLGCRINFDHMSLAQLTPSKLLAEKLVFSPVPVPKRSLDAISEEGSSMDIGKELDQYQLELENSINEAKLRKNGVVEDVKVEIEQRVTFTQKLSNIVEETEEDEEEKVQNATYTIKENTILKTPNVKEKLEEITEVENDDVVYASDSEDEHEELSIEVPTRFVRAYRRADSPKRVISKESLNSIATSTHSTENVSNKKSMSVKNLIRKSIRKLMHNTTPNVEDVEKQPKHNLLNTIRHSLRRKPHKQLIDNQADESIKDSEKPKKCEISIVDTSEKRTKLKSNLLRNEFATVEQLTLEKKPSFRQSLRRSTRGLSQQLMKSVFHKEHEEYALRK